MAEARVSVNLDDFTCPVCLDLLKDPVSVPCGHSFCKNCINTQWDREVHKGVYSCPVCKHHCSPRPVLGRNVMLAEMVEKLKKTRVPERTLAGPEDVECDVCVRQKHKAVKSCLVCLASYCEVHFNLHEELHPGNTHTVTEARSKLRNRLCSWHQELKKFFCVTEERFVCSGCLQSGCKSHDTTTITDKRFYQQREIGNVQAQVLQRSQSAESSLKDLRKAIHLIKTSAQTTLDQSEKIFMDLILSAERKRSEIRDMVKATKEAEVQRAVDMLQCVEQEVTTLRKRDKDLVQLAQLNDDFLFVRTFMFLSDLSSCGDVPQVTVNLSPFKELQSSLERFSITGLDTQPRSANRCHMVQTSVPIIREDFLQYFRQLTVDPRSAYKALQLSEGNRKITFDDTKPNNNRGPEVFNYFAQALCREALQERCYWEVEWGGQRVYIAVAYGDVERHGCCSEVNFGQNIKSWSLCCNSSQFEFFHNSRKTVISGPVSTRVGIYLDYRAGSLSFYSITNTMTLLHRVCTSFTKPLYAGFWVFDYSSVKLCGRNEKVLPHTPPLPPPAATKTSLCVDQFYFESYNVSWSRFE
ncbi:E3 ubiquitin-protein ligase TRIM65-like isoform X1 [Hemibagrus wyckioides]|uniref:E3 ubiquitin-protein ligase TRIM65-like isoform X1 n=2 Tax=Hemibagrus wyckioides TaxID=337641 RepID=UPI00266D3945|nr:E3 ubiquitin-protein ligase TRIM65-like isoform X1 [Hemibagrus wyckioides]